MCVLLGLVLIVGIGSFAGGIYIELARGGAVFVLLLQIVVELKGGDKRFITSPLFLLSAIGIFFFSVTQAIWVPEGPWPTKVREFTLYIGSQAEAVIISFCMACLIGYIWASRRPTYIDLITKAPNFLNSNRLIFFLFTLVIGLSVSDVALKVLITTNVGMSSFVAKAHFIVPPLLALSFCLLVHASPKRGVLYKGAVFLCLMTSLGGLIYVGESKIVLFILASILLYIFRLFDFSFSH